MAEIILTPLVELLVDRLISEVLKYAFQPGSVDPVVKHLQNWEERLKRLKMVLEDANEKQHPTREVKAWLDDLTGLAYKMEDVLFELFPEANLQGKLIGVRQASMTSKVRNLALACFNSSTPSHVVEVESTMREKIEEISNRFDELMKQKDKLNFNQTVDGTANTIAKKRQATCLVRTKDHMYGREEDAEAVLNLLLNNDGLTELNAICITGMVGIGKTRLAQFVYHHMDVVSFFQLKAWVSVSEDFDVEAITKKILICFTNPEINCNNMDLDNLQLKLKEAIRGKSFLIVLDDVWNRDSSKWNLLCSPFEAMAPASSIIITTRNQEVSSRMTAFKVRPYRLRSLSNDACLSIFAQHALHSTDFSAHPKLKGISEKIVSNCKGLPLAVKAVGSLLHNNEAEKGKWELFSNSTIWDTLELSGDVPSLMLTYHHLPSHLKKCFAYCSVFPKGYEFEKNQVVLLWMAQGLIQSRDQNIELEVLGREYFNDLISWSLFEESYKDKSRFLMHDLINDLAQLVAGQSSAEQGNVRHLSYVGGKYDGNEKLNEFFEQRCLRTFLPLKLPCPRYCYLPAHAPSELIARLPLLRVLSLRGYRITELPDSIHNLKHLRYLDLSETSIGSLPESITTLCYLQTLLLENCQDLKSLPSELWKLVNLRCLNIVGTIHLEGMPMQIGKLMCLQSLSNYMVVGGDHSTCAGMKELGSLPHLGGTLCISRLENVTQPREAEDANLSSKLLKITGLSLEWSKCNISGARDQLEVLEKLKPHKNLEELTIRNYGGEDFPTWLSSSCPSVPYFLDMVSLKIENCENCKLLPPIGKLSSLKMLSIGGMANIKNVGLEFCGDGISMPFKSLEILHFKGMKVWKNWSPCEEFPNLRELSLGSCPKLLGNVPTSLPLLNKLKIYDCGQLVISVSNFPDLCKVEIAGSKGVVFRGMVEFSSLEISSCLSDQSSRFTSQLVESSFHIQGLTTTEDLTILNCEELRRLWASDVEGSLFPQLPLLRHLRIERCPKLVSLVSEEDVVDEQLQLTEIVIKNCIALESLPKAVMYNSASCLKLLRIVKCDSLEHIARGQLPPTLERLEVSGCKNLQFLLVDDDDGNYSCSSTTASLYLKIHYCPSLEYLTSSRELPASIKSLELLDCPKLMSIANRFHPNSFLECIQVSFCENLQSLPTGIRTLRTLHNIVIKDCPNLGCSSDQEWQLPANLRVLYISGCHQIRSLPTDIQDHTPLQKLTLKHSSCPDNVSFLEGGFPANITSLSISHHKITDASFKKLTSLNILEISKCPHDLVSFPEMMLPESLTNLKISHCPNLKHLSSKGFKKIKALKELIISDCGKLVSFSKYGLPASLEKLYIKKCQKLKSFPKNGVPPSLQQLYIFDCPLLKQRYQKDQGRQWRKISQLYIFDCPLLKQRYQKDQGRQWRKISHVPLVEFDS